MNLTPSFTAGTVIAVNPARNTCDVRLVTGGIQYNVPPMNSTGGLFSNDSCALPNMLGAAVAMMQVLGVWYILGTLPTQGTNTHGITPSSTETKSAAENDKTYGRELSVPNGHNYSSGRSLAVMPGDKLLSADGGSELFLGAEGLTVLKASPLAQLILGAFKDFGKLICREFEIYTDFGVLKFSGGGPTGKTSLSILGGANYCDESGTKSPMYTVKLYMGDVPGDPEARFAVYVTDTENTETASIVMDKQGSLNIGTTKNFEERIWRDKKTYVDRDAFHYVIGDQTTVIGDNPDAELENAADPERAVQPVPSGFRTTTVKKDDTLSVERDAYTTVFGNNTESVGGSETRNVGADSSVTVGGSETRNVADVYSIVCGLLNITTGGLTITKTAEAPEGPLTFTCPPINLVSA